MKHYFSILFLSIGSIVIGQSNNSKEITPQVVLKLNAAIEKEVPTLKVKLQKKEFTTEQIEFSIDTFRIEQLVSKRMDIDYSTVGMNTTVM
jgi:hypothetical protein